MPNYNDPDDFIVVEVANDEVILIPRFQRKETTIPNYTFENKETGEEFIENMFMDELEPYLAANPHLRQIFAPTALVYRPDFRIDDGARDILRRIKKTSPGSNMNTYG